MVDNDKIEQKTKDAIIDQQKSIADNSGKKQKKHIIPVGNIDTYPEDENAHIVGSNTFVDGVVFDDSFEYVIHNPVKRFFMTLLWFTGIALLSIVDTFVFGFYIKGKKHVAKVIKDKKGAITVSNHCVGIDCVMACQANWPKMSYLPTLHTTFQLPYVRHIVHWLNAFPIPNTTSGTIKFVKEVDELLQNKKFVHFFPEASLWPWYDRIRKFKPGAFSFACRNNVPVIAQVVLFRPRKLTKFLKRPKISIEILEPFYPNPDLKGHAQVNELMQRVHDAMEKKMIENNMKYYGVKSTKAHLD
ncbi:MAG: 1-acyl-sn-glycerol-3-phosphate acyltransferase [Christensenella sp.]|nr:1-acyl-sn-glycerol-3-phosphate acyltransferase [Christensenella sp.]